MANDRTRINRDDIRPDSISGVELKSDDSSLNKVTDGIMLIEGTGSNRNVTISRPLISSNDIIFSGSVRNIGTASNLNLNFITNNQVRMILQGDGNIRLGASGTASEKLDVDGNIKATKFIGPLEGNANTATKWATGRTISLTGGVTGSVSGVDGSGNISISTTLSPHSLASHTVSGLTPGHFLKALTATTFGFSPHGLTYSDVGAAPASHTHNYDNYQNWVLKVNSESTGVNIETKDNVNLIAGTNVTLSRSGTGVTISSSDTKYTAGNGLTLSGTQFSLDAYTNAELTAGTMGEIGVNSTGAYVVLGENSKTAYRGDRGKAAYDHISSTGASHTYINQDVKTTASPTFAGLTLTGKLQVANSTTHAMLNIPRIGTADPTNYSAGDLWHRSNNLYYVDSSGTVRALAHTSSWSAMSQAEIETGTATSSRFMRADRLKYAVEYHAPVKSVAGKTGTVTLSSSDVGLGSVNNYGIASQAQAQAGTVNTVYMTPLRTKEAILALTPIPTWGSITDKPSTFPPSAHNHPWSQITDKPSTFEPSAHTHSASNITSGTLSVDRLPSATTSGKGIVQLSTSTSSTSTSLAATASAVKSAYDLANSKWTYNEATIKAVKVNSAVSADTASSVTWANVTGKPSTFPPSSGGTLSLTGTSASNSALTVTGPADHSAHINLRNTGSEGGNFHLIATNSGWTHGSNRFLITSGGASSTNFVFSVDGAGNPRWKGSLQEGTVPWARISGAPATATRWPSWSEVTDKPSTFAPASHNHSTSNITSGTLGVARGGTGASTLASGKVLVGNGTGAILQPTNLHWNNSSSRLGIGTTAPNEALHVAGKTESTQGFKTGNFEIVYDSTSKCLNFNFVG